MPRYFRFILKVGLILISNILYAQPKRVVVLSFEGPDSFQAQSLIITFLEESMIEIIPEAEYYAEAELLGIEPKGPDNIAKIAKNIKADAVVEGRVMRKQEKWTFIIIVRNGADGELLGRISGDILGLAKLREALKRAKDKIISLIQEGSKETSVIPEEWSLIEKENSFQDSKEDIESLEMKEEEPWKKKKKPKLKIKEIQLSKPLEDPFVELEVGICVMYRYFDLPWPDKEQPLKYHTKGYSAFGFKIEGYPSVFIKDPFWSNLGLTLKLGKELFLQSKELPKKTGGEVPKEVTLSSSQFQFEIGLVYRWKKESSLGDIFIKPSFGYGRFAYEIDENDHGLMSFLYDYLYIGAAGYLPFSTEYAGLEFGFSIKLVRGVGEKATSFYTSEEKRKVDASGWSIWGALKGKLKGNLFWRFKIIEYMDFKTNFSRTEKDGGDIQAKDRYWQMGINIGYGFR
jgi:hypothetical protein